MPRSPPLGLPPSTADLSTLEGIEAERRDLERLHRDGLIDREALAAGLEALKVMAKTRRLAKRHRQ